MKIDLNKISIFHILIISFLARIIAAYFFSDQKLENEWAILVHNIQVSGILGINVVLDEFTAVNKLASEGDKVLPSVFMPPLYAYYIYFLKVLSQNLVNISHIVIFTQILISIITILFFFKITKKLFNSPISTILVIIFSFFPLYVYSATQISSITLQIFLLVSFFYYLQKILNNNKLLDIILFSFISGLSILIRGEFIFFYFLTLLYFFIFSKVNLKLTILTIVFTLITISPYLKRNFDNFGKIVITKSFGYNLLKGNNEENKVEGSDIYIIKNHNQANLNISTDKNYEIVLDDYYKKTAFKIISKDPAKYIYQYIKKLLSFLFLDFDSTYNNYYNVLHIFPKILISLVSLFGGLICLKKRGILKFFAIYYFSNAFIFSLFFILPRYSLMMLPIQLVLSVEVFNFFRRKSIY